MIRRRRRTREELAEAQRITAENVRVIEEINAARIKAGTCRHCGGPVPCWAEQGDQAIGVRHTRASWRARRASSL